MGSGFPPSDLELIFALKRNTTHPGSFKKSKCFFTEFEISSPVVAWMWTTLTLNFLQSLEKPCLASFFLKKSQMTSKNIFQISLIHYNWRLKQKKEVTKKVRPKSDVTVTHCSMCKNLRKGFLRLLTPPTHLWLGEAAVMGWKYLSCICIFWWSTHLKVFCFCFKERL